MIGTIVNVGGIVVGGIAGLSGRRALRPVTESNLKVILGVFTVYYGLRLAWLSLGGSVGQVLKQVLIAVLALTVGKLAGRLLGLQRMSNALGRAARQKIAEARPDNPRRLGEGFKVCAALFCAAPLGVAGAVQDGLSQYWYPLGVKAAMDGLATMSFVSLFGGGAMLSAVPVLAVQGTITLACGQFLKPFLEGRALVDSVNAVGGLVVFCVALVILGLKRIELAEYLPSLLFGPLLTWLWR